MHNLLNEKRNNRAKLDAFSQDYLTLLTSAYFPTETKIFMRIKRKIDATFFEDARNIRDKDIERAASRPRYNVHLIEYKYYFFSPALQFIPFCCIFHMLYK